MDDALFIDASAEGCVAEVFVNDVPAALVGEGRPRRVGRPIGTLVVPGDNEVRLEVRAVPGTPSSGDEEERARVRVARFRDGEHPDSDSCGTVVAELTSPNGTGAPRKSSLRLSLPGSGRWSFQDAPVLTLTEDLLDDAEQLLRQLADVLTRGDVEAFVALNRRFFEEHHRAYPLEDRAAFDAAHTRFVTSFSQGGRVVLAPRSAWDVRLVAHGRLLDARAKGEAPIVTLVQPNGLAGGYPLLLGRDGGLLAPLR